VFPGFDRLYVASDPLADRPFRAKLEGDFDDACLLVRGEQRAEALIASHAMGERTPGDVVWTTWAIPLLLAQPVVDACRAANFSGWTTLPVALQDRHGDDRSFQLLVVTGRWIKLAWTAKWSAGPDGFFAASRDGAALPVYHGPTTTSVGSPSGQDGKGVWRKLTQGLYCGPSLPSPQTVYFKGIKVTG